LDRTLILHLALRSDWDEARTCGVYDWSTRGAKVADVGYTHCSFEHQWRGVRDRFYADLADDELVLLVIDESRLQSPVVVERLDGAPDEFPHIYGTIDIDAVVGERSISSPAE
jgi:glutathione S-transferase